MSTFTRVGRYAIKVEPIKNTWERNTGFKNVVFFDEAHYLIAICLDCTACILNSPLQKIRAE